MHRLDDLGVVDALEVDGRDPEVAMAELAPDHDQRHPFARHLDRVRVPELVRRKAPADACRDGCPTQVRSRGCVGPVVATCRAVDDAEQRSHGKLDSHLEPRLDLLPAPRVDADLAAASALAASNEQRAAAVIEVGFGSASASWMRSPARQRITIRPRSRRPWAPSPAARITAMISSTLGGSAGYRSPLLRGGRPAWNPGIVAGDRRRPA
jgi:hypothetical protein